MKNRNIHTCIFCEEWGFSPEIKWRLKNRRVHLKKSIIIKIRKIIRKKIKATKKIIKKKVLLKKKKLIVFNKKEIIKKMYKRRDRCSQPAWIKLRKKIKKNFNNLCGECQNTGHAVHHILSVREYPELEYAIDNLILLCKPCHRKRHPTLNASLFK